MDETSENTAPMTMTAEESALILGLDATSTDDEEPEPLRERKVNRFETTVNHPKRKVQTCFLSL